MVERSRIVLETAMGKPPKILPEFCRCVWLRGANGALGFSRDRLAGLEDAPRPGKTAKYNKITEKRILARLDAPPPAGYASWTGRLVAEALTNPQFA